MMSPAIRGAFSIGLAGPLIAIPLVDARSSMVACPPRRVIRAWRPETLGESRTMSLAASRPTEISNPTLERLPAGALLLFDPGDEPPGGGLSGRRVALSLGQGMEIVWPSVTSSLSRTVTGEEIRIPLTKVPFREPR